MSNLGTALTIMASGFIVGALARLAVPGPDPMPAWLTIAIGLVGSFIGGAIGAVASGRDPYGISTGSFVAAWLLVIAYRKLVQKRPAFGPEALRFPHRGIGVQGYRERLAQAGVDPDALIDRALEQRRREHETRHTPPHDESPQPPRDKEKSKEESSDSDS